jgi:Tfp pilus assembly protein PilF
VDYGGDPETCFAWGNALMLQGHFAEAVLSYEQCLQLRPDFAECQSNLGMAFAEQGELTTAVDRYRQALAINPDLADANYNLGNALRELGRWGDAESSYDRALRSNPDWPEAHTNLGLTYAEQGNDEAAVASHRTALRLDPDFAEAHNNLGIVLARQAKIDEALHCFDRTIEQRPDFATAHCNRAQIWLVKGDFARGWREYEWRRRVPGFRPPPAVAPDWDGAPLEGETVLLDAEQGFGDALQFIRYASQVKHFGGRVIVFSPPELARLLATSPGVEQVVTDGDALPPVRVQAALMSLPRIFGTSPTSIPADVPYLFADRELVGTRRRELRAVQSFNVGIAWRGNPRHTNDRHRSIPLDCFLSLSRIPGVRLVSLQKGAGAQEAEHTGGRVSTLSLGDFMDTAAVMMNLDLIITVDTAVAHLAGSLGVPVWVALPVSSEWRWMLNREDSPWYPTMRLFRQSRPAEWADVFENMTNELARICQ